jgi:hypothetical protein
MRLSTKQAVDGTHTWGKSCRVKGFGQMGLVVECAVRIVILVVPHGWRLDAEQGSLAISGSGGRC